MGHIASATTVYSKAYLTELGRSILFNENGQTRFDTSGSDLFEMKFFALSDPDVNYGTTERLVSGEIPNVTGEEANTTAVSDIEQRNKISYDGKLDTAAGVATSVAELRYEYQTDKSPDDEIIIDVNGTNSSLPI